MPTEKSKVSRDSTLRVKGRVRGELVDGGTGQPRGCVIPVWDQLTINNLLLEFSLDTILGQPFSRANLLEDSVDHSCPFDLPYSCVHIVGADRGHAS